LNYKNIILSNRGPTREMREHQYNVVKRLSEKIIQSAMKILDNLDEARDLSFIISSLGQGDVERELVAFYQQDLSQMITPVEIQETIEFLKSPRRPEDEKRRFMQLGLKELLKQIEEWKRELLSDDGYKVYKKSIHGQPREELPYTWEGFVYYEVFKPTMNMLFAYHYYKTNQENFDDFKENISHQINSFQALHSEEDDEDEESSPKQSPPTEQSSSTERATPSKETAKPQKQDQRKKDEQQKFSPEKREAFVDALQNVFYNNTISSYVRFTTFIKQSNSQASAPQQLTKTIEHEYNKNKYQFDLSKYYDQFENYFKHIFSNELESFSSNSNTIIEELQSHPTPIVDLESFRNSNMTLQEVYNIYAMHYLSNNASDDEVQTWLNSVAQSFESQDENDLEKSIQDDLKNKDLDELYQEIESLIKENSYFADAIARSMNNKIFQYLRNMVQQGNMPSDTQGKKIPLFGNIKLAQKYQKYMNIYGMQSLADQVVERLFEEARQSAYGIKALTTIANTLGIKHDVHPLEQVIDYIRPQGETQQKNQEFQQKQQQEGDASQESQEEERQKTESAQSIEDSAPSEPNQYAIAYETASKSFMENSAFLPRQIEKIIYAVFLDKEYVDLRIGLASESDRPPSIPEKSSNRANAFFSLINEQKELQGCNTRFNHIVLLVTNSLANVLRLDLKDTYVPSGVRSKKQPQSLAAEHVDFISQYNQSPGRAEFFDNNPKEKINKIDQVRKTIRLSDQAIEELKKSSNSGNVSRSLVKILQDIASEDSSQIQHLVSQIVEQLNNYLRNKKTSKSINAHGATKRQVLSEFFESNLSAELEYDVTVNQIISITAQNPQLKEIVDDFVKNAPYTTQETKKTELTPQDLNQINNPDIIDSYDRAFNALVEAFQVRGSSGARDYSIGIHNFGDITAHKANSVHEYVIRDLLSICGVDFQVEVEVPILEKGKQIGANPIMKEFSEAFKESAGVGKERDKKWKEIHPDHSVFKGSEEGTKSPQNPKVDFQFPQSVNKSGKPLLFEVFGRKQHGDYFAKMATKAYNWDFFSYVDVSNVDKNKTLYNYAKILENNTMTVDRNQEMSSEERKEAIIKDVNAWADQKTSGGQGVRSKEAVQISGATQGSLIADQQGSDWQDRLESNIPLLGINPETQKAVADYYDWSEKVFKNNAGAKEVLEVLRSRVSILRSLGASSYSIQALLNMTDEDITTLNENLPEEISQVLKKHEFSSLQDLINKFSQIATKVKQSVNQGSSDYIVDTQSDTYIKKYKVSQMVTADQYPEVDLSQGQQEIDERMRRFFVIKMVPVDQISTEINSRYSSAYFWDEKDKIAVYFKTLENINNTLEEIIEKAQSFAYMHQLYEADWSELIKDIYDVYVYISQGRATDRLQKQLGLQATDQTQTAPYKFEDYQQQSATPVQQSATPVQQPTSTTQQPTPETPAPNYEPIGRAAKPEYHHFVKFSKNDISEKEAKEYLIDLSKNSKFIKKLFKWHNVPFSRLEDLTIKFKDLGKKYGKSNKDEVWINEKMLDEDDWKQAITHIYIHELNHWLNRQKEDDAYLADPEEIQSFTLGMAWEIASGKSEEDIKKVYKKIMKKHFDDKTLGEKVYNEMFQTALRLQRILQ